MSVFGVGGRDEERKRGERETRGRERRSCVEKETRETREVEFLDQRVFFVFFILL